MINIKITKIEKQKKNKNRFSIYVDGEFLFGIDEETRFKYSLKEDMEVTYDFLNEILLHEKGNEVINFSLNYLSYRPRSEHELRSHLEAKDFSPNLIEAAIDYCKDKGYINDYDFAELYYNNKVNVSKHGSFRIKYELRQKGVSDDIINQVIDENPEDEYIRAVELAEKKLYSYRNDDKNKKYRKLGGFLQRRGFPYHIVSDVLKEVLKDE